MRYLHCDYDALLTLPYSVVLTAIDLHNNANRAPDELEDW